MPAGGVVGSGLCAWYRRRAVMVPLGCSVVRAWPPPRLDHGVRLAGPPRSEQKPVADGGSDTPVSDWRKAGVAVSLRACCGLPMCSSAAVATSMRTWTRGSLFTGRSWWLRRSSSTSGWRGCMSGGGRDSVGAVLAALASRGTAALARAERLSSALRWLGREGQTWIQKGRVQSW